MKRLLSVIVLFALGLAQNVSEDLQKLLELSLSPDAKVFPGALAPDFPTTLPKPNAKLIGTVQREPRSGVQEVYFTVSRPIFEVVAEYQRALREAGWVERITDGLSGFVGARNGFGGWSCPTNPSHALQWNILQRNNEVLIILRVMLAAQGSTCTLPTPPNQFSVPLPLLRLPEGVQYFPTGRNGNPQLGGISDSVSFVSSQSQAALLEFFGAQLTAQGWLRIGLVTQGELQYSRWTLRDTSGQDWYTVLTVFADGPIFRDNRLAYLLTLRR